MTDDRAVGAPERLHPLFLLTGIGGALRGLAGGYAFVGYLFVSGRLAEATIALVVLLLLVGVGIFLYWARFEFRVGDNEIRIDSGIISRTHRSIPFDRIQDVEIAQGPIARLLGLAKVKFETGGSGGRNEDEGSLLAIPLVRAQQIRELVRARRSGAAPTAAEEPDEERPPVYAMDLGRVLLAGLFNFSLALFAGLIGLTQTFGDLFGFDPLNRAFWAPLLTVDHPITRFVLSNQVAAAVAGLIVLVAAGVLTGVTRTMLREYGFRLDRTGSGLRRRRGLFSRSDVTLRSARVQAAIVGTGPVRDAFGWRRLTVQSLAKDEGGMADHVLAPLASDDEVGTILAELGWRPVPAGIEWQRVSSAYVWSLAAGLLPLSLVGVAQMLVTPLPGLLFELALGAALAVRFVAWRRTRYALDGDRLLIRTGWWRRRLLILPIRRIQSIDLRQSFVSRWFGAAALAFGVAGGGGFGGHQIPALAEEKARTLRAQLLSSLL